jgi:L-histidine N-alpha-methyltransferase
MNSEFACDVRVGLSKPQKELYSKYLYDDLGSALFDAITQLPEYGLTRADERILGRHACEIPREFGTVAELGSGSGRKTRPVLEALRAAQYFPIDLSCAALERCGRELAGSAEIVPLEMSYLEGLTTAAARRNGDPMLTLFLGSTIGNFEPRCRAEFLTQVRSRLRAGDALLIGFDLVKPVETMIQAYDDPTGVTASFNLNLLGRVNRELGGDFDLRAFAHEARFNAGERSIEMHLRSRRGQTVSIARAGFRCEFGEGETIWTESSYKFLLEEIPAMARAAGFSWERQWVDEEWPFVESLWRVSAG